MNEELKETLNEKIQAGQFAAADIPDFFTIFCEMGNELEDLADEVEGWNRRIQFVLTGLGNYFFIIEDGRFSFGQGMVKEPNLLLTMDASDAAQVFAGRKDAEAALMSGALMIDGDLPDAIKMHSLIEIVGEEIEY